MTAPTDSTRSQHHEVARRFIDHRSAVRQPAVSPDGSRVAYVVATVDVETNTTRTVVWIDDTPVTAGPNDSSPCWSPDGRTLAVVTSGEQPDENTALRLLPVDRPGETRTLCSMSDGLGAPAFSPDGRWVAFTSRTPHERYALPSVAWQPPRKVERFFARLDNEGWIEDRPEHIYVVRTDGTEAPRNLTPGPFQHDGVSWLADSSGVITGAARHDSWDRDLASDLYLVPLDADEHPDHIRCLTAHDGNYSRPSVSPDGSLVAFVGHGELATFPQNAAVGVLSTAASGATEADIVWASAALDRSFHPTNCSAAPVWDSRSTVLAVVDDRGDAPMLRVTVDGSVAPVRVTEGAHTVLDVSAAGGTIATVRSTVTVPPELYVGVERRTTVSRHTAASALPWERFTVPTTDGTEEIDAWIMRPADADGSVRHPVLLNVHGGPFTQYGEVFFDEAQMQAAAGFVVLMCNPRGGSGRDTAWGQSILGTEHPLHPGTGWGSVDVDDVLAVLDAALDRYGDLCDPDRVGMIGGSYGGYMATWFAAYHGDRFRAICSERAVNNLLSEEWSSDISTAFRTEHGPSHVESPEAYSSRSPVNDVRNITTPMLLIHSEDDLRCPIVQAEELWVALRLLDREVDFYRFPGEGHELSRSGSPVHRVQRAEIILDWFSEKLAVGDAVS